MGASPLRVGVPADDERASERALDLQPIRAAHSPIAGLAPFRNYAFQAGFLDLVIEFAALTNHVVAIAQWTVTTNELTEQMFALLKWQFAKVITIEGENIEQEVVDRDGETEARDLTAVLDVHPALQQLKAGFPPLIEGNDFAIHDEPVEGQAVEGQRYFRIACGDLSAAAREQARVLAIANRQRPDTVVLQLE